jgi:hypothetical protein
MLLLFMGYSQLQPSPLVFTKPAKPSQSINQSIHWSTAFEYLLDHNNLWVINREQKCNTLERMTFSKERIAVLIP